MKFDCAYITAKTTEKGAVYHMHGNDGLRAKGMFAATMIHLASVGYTSLACDARGYSPGAAPEGYSDYGYNKLAADVFAIVDAEGLAAHWGGKFHVVAHDQGARVAWHAIAKGTGRSRFLSFSSLSIPHSDLFSNALYGANSDSDQVKAAQYVRLLVLPNSTEINDDAIFNKLCKGEGFSSPEACEKSLWWYNGAIDDGAMALSPLVVPYTAVTSSLGITSDQCKGLTQYSLKGVPQTVKVGKVTNFPVFYACGQKDSSDLCKTTFGDQSAKLITKFSYMRLANCGHNVLGCSSAADVKKLISGITTNIQSASENSGRDEH